MDSESQQRYQTASFEVDVPVNRTCAVGKHAEAQNIQRMNIPDPNPCRAVVEHPSSPEFITQLNSGRLLMVNSRRRNGLVIYKQFHAEFAGPGAAVGGFFDVNCTKAIAVGDLSLIDPNAHEERQKAYLIRRQWIRLTQQFTDNAVPLQRAQMILNQFDNYFDPDTVAQLPDEAFALLVGVLPQTIRMVRQGSTNLNAKTRR
ncbi:hypothetical protein H6F90_26485 [Trichocoleus sp. FACHB-591]|uniref:hypothetical protein n=1 Tax=Trichocoleus TaxID=450526 RepID=UPI0016843A59|nr:hypothetical protein [Trichocoleus sp. FACHB-591]MBD2098615.1 hypothetical protein [Trichocoleus sp. FACHB-591]